MTLRLTPGRRLLAVLLAGTAFQSLAAAQSNSISFTQGDLVVSVEGDGSNTGSYLDNQAAPLSLYQFQLNNAANGVIAGTTASKAGSLMLPQTSTVGGNYAVSGEYGSSSEGTLQLTGNGQALTIMGYAVNAAAYNATYDVNGTGTALAQSTNGTGAASDVSRVIAVIGANGSVNSTTALTNVFNANNPRSVYSTNGTSFYISGQGNKDTTGGVYYVSSVGATTATPITGVDTNSKSNGSYNQDTRDVQVVNGQLVTSVDSTEGSSAFVRDMVGTVGTGTPTTTLNQAPTALSGITGKISLANGDGNSINGSSGKVYLSPEQFYYANANTLYIADSGNPKSCGLGDGCLQKWTLSNGTWTLDYTLAAGLGLVSDTNTTGTSGLFGLTGQVVTINGKQEVELFATSEGLADTDQSYLFGITDQLSDTTAAQASSESFVDLAAAPADSTFRGVAFAPVAAAVEVPEPSSLSLLAAMMAVVGGIGLARRRRAIR